MHTNFEKRKVPQAFSGNSAKTWVLCKTYVLDYVCFFICGQSSWTTRLKQIILSIGIFQGKFTFTRETY